MSLKKQKRNEGTSHSVQESSESIYAGSEKGIILFAMTCFEWQAVNWMPVDFTEETQKRILTRAIKCQLRDFKSDAKPYQYRDIHKK